MADKGLANASSGLSAEEWAAIREYDVWAEEELGHRTTRLVKWFLAVGVAATVAIAAAMLWWAGTTRDARNDEGISAGGQFPQEEPAGEKANTGETHRVRLVYRVPGNPDFDTVGDVAGVLRRRLVKLGFEMSQLVAQEDGVIKVFLPPVTAEDLVLVKRTLTSPGELLFAIEALPEELADPVAGLGPDFDADKFKEEQARKVAQRRKENPQRYDGSYTGETVNLYENSDNVLVPKGPGERPRFTYYPPYRWKSSEPGLQGAAGWKGPESGAIVHTRPDMVVSGQDLETAFLTTDSRGSEPVVWFEFRGESKRAFRELTRKNVGRNLCIIFNDRLVTRPVMQTELPGSGIIERIGNAADRRMLVASVGSGRLKAVPVLVREEVRD